MNQIDLSPERTVWRDVNVALSPMADPQAAEFLAFLIADEAQALMATEGWQR